MSPSEIYSALTEVFQEVFDDDSITLSADTTADDIEGWDSQAHVNLVVAAETRFGVRFRTAELETLHNVGDFVALIAAKQGRSGHG
jgi:acyl carrier protein